MKNLNLNRFSLVLFAAFALCFIGLSLFSGEPVVNVVVALRIAYRAVPILVVICGIFVASAWKWRIFRGWLVPFPNLNGTWRGEIQTTWKDPTTGKEPGPIPTSVAIRQTFTRISCVMNTGEMTSRSFLADFWLDGDQQIKKFGYCYYSEPRATVRERSQPHSGTAILEIAGDPPSTLRGAYWSDRKTTGEIVLKFVGRGRGDDSAARLGPHPMNNRGVPRD